MSTNKRFPANTTLTEQTFLNDKKINGELYALLQTYSFPNENKETVIIKKNLPSQTELCAQLGIKSPKTYRAHLAYLIEKGYVIDTGKEYYLPNVEEIYLMIPLETAQFLKDTLKEQVIKVYIYLGQRFKYKPGYVFTLEEVAEHVGIKLDGNQRNYNIINNALVCLRNNGLVEYAEFYEGRYPKKRLTGFSFQHKN